MRCPACKETGSLVIDSRTKEYSHSCVRRRRECPSCGKRWTTYEVPLPEGCDLRNGIPEPAAPGNGLILVRPTRIRAAVELAVKDTAAYVLDLVKENGSK